jgi:hypothetical protein
MKTDISKTMRRVNWDEIVRQGDFVIAGKDFEPWEGPSGFRADSFTQPIYRKQASPDASRKNK